MIERHITFNVLPDKTGAFEKFFVEQYRPAMARSKGFVRCDLLREADHPARYQMVLRFDTLEDSAGWRNSEIHQALQPQLKSLYQDNEILAYQVIA